MIRGWGRDGPLHPGLPNSPSYAQAELPWPSGTAENPLHVDACGHPKVVAGPSLLNIVQREDAVLSHFGPRCI